jgi:hypothetical protein
MTVQSRDHASKGGLLQPMSAAGYLVQLRRRPQPARIMYMRQALIIAGVLLAGPVDAAPSLWLQEQTGNMHRIAGPFVSADYGFSIQAPPEATEYVTNGGDANHGPILILGEGRKIAVYPEYTGFIAGDAQPCKRNQFPWEPGSKKVTAVGSLNGRHACIVTFTQGSAIWRVMQTTGTDRGTGIMYTLTNPLTFQTTPNTFVNSG